MQPHGTSGPLALASSTQQHACALHLSNSSHYLLLLAGPDPLLGPRPPASHSPAEGHRIGPAHRPCGDCVYKWSLQAPGSERLSSVLWAQTWEESIWPLGQVRGAAPLPTVAAPAWFPPAGPEGCSPASSSCFPPGPLIRALQRCEGLLTGLAVTARGWRASPCARWLAVVFLGEMSLQMLSHY